MTRHSERQGEPGGWKAGWSGLEGQHQGYRSQKGWGLNRDLRENQALTSPRVEDRCSRQRKLCAKAWK